MDTAYHHNQHPRRWPRAHRRSSVRTNVLLIAFGPCGEAQYPHTNVLSSEVALFTFFFYMPFHSRADSLVLCATYHDVTNILPFLGRSGDDHAAQTTAASTRSFKTIAAAVAAARTQRTFERVLYRIVSVFIWVIDDIVKYFVTLMTHPLRLWVT